MVKSSLSYLGLLIVAWGLFQVQKLRRQSCDEFLRGDSFLVRKERFQSLRGLQPLPSRCAWFYGSTGKLAPREAWVSQVSGVIHPSVCVVGGPEEWRRCGAILSLAGYETAIEEALLAAGEKSSNWTRVDIPGLTYVRRK